MKTLSISSINRSVSTPSMTGILSRNPVLVRRLNRMTGSRIPMLRAARRRGTMNQSMPWIIGAGAVALVGAGLRWAARKLGGRRMMSRRSGGGIMVEEHGYTISEKYPAGAASAGSIPTPSRAARRR